MAEKNIVENRPAEDIKERFSSNETVNTVMNGLGKVVDYPMGVVGNLTVKNNAVDASVKPGKALGQSMLMGIVAFGLSLLLGNGLLGSLGFGLGAGIMGQEIRTMGGNLVDTIKGIIGKRDDPEANMWLNPQSWAVISGFASDEQADKALEMVYERLNTEYGAILMDPPYHAHAFDGALAVIYNAGTKENAGIFSQSQGWIILAEALKGHGDRAFKYFIENAPAAQNDRAEIRRLEPYCYGQFTEGKASPNFGRSHVHWLTGTASTVMVGCVEGILGMRPDFYGLHIAPSIPKAWDGFEIEKDFRGCHLHIVVKNPDHVESGCKSLLVNGQAVEGDYIPKELLSEQTEIELTM